ncbi:hypothetical protein IF2G_02210 [Cordyceps javanica]|nr:hypothetical protein IF2G_02210 [Cordyceps javanica]
MMQKEIYATPISRRHRGKGVRPPRGREGAVPGEHACSQREKKQSNSTAYFPSPLRDPLPPPRSRGLPYRDEQGNRPLFRVSNGCTFVGGGAEEGLMGRHRYLAACLYSRVTVLVPNREMRPPKPQLGCTHASALSCFEKNLPICTG